MNKFLLLILLVFTISCSPNKSNSEADAQKIDSLISLVGNLNSKVAKMDSALQAKNNNVTRVETISDRVDLKPKKIFTKPEKTEIEVKPTVAQKPINDTIFYYFDDKRLSVKMLPFLEGRQQIKVYRPNGDIIFETENVRLSYHVSNELKFRNNGSLELIKSSMNPGASLYWYESTIGFDIDNEPLYKQTFRQPYESVNDAMGEKYLWDKLNRKWVKQELIIETNMPK